MSKTDQDKLKTVGEEKHVEESQGKNSVKKRKDISKIIISSKVINLLPPISEEEVKEEVAKTKISFGIILPTLFFLLISVAVIGFNIHISKQLSKEEAELRMLEQEVQKKNSIVLKNNTILQRVYLYKKVYSELFAPRELLLYWNSVISGLGTISSIQINADLSFVIAGSTSSLQSVAQIWHLLSVDKNILTLNLDSFSTAQDHVNFVFSGKLDFESFKLLTAKNDNN